MRGVRRFGSVYSSKDSGLPPRVRASATRHNACTVDHTAPVHLISNQPSRFPFRRDTSLSLTERESALTTAKLQVVAHGYRLARSNMHNHSGGARPTPERMHSTRKNASPPTVAPSSTSLSCYQPPARLCGCSPLTFKPRGAPQRQWRCSPRDDGQRSGKPCSRRRTESRKCRRCTSWRGQESAGERRRR